MEESAALTRLIILAIAAGVSAQTLANLCKLPSIVFLLVFGAAMGGNGFGLIRPQLLDSGLAVIVSLCVALILFEGGLSLELRALGKVSASVRNLVTLGALITLVGGGVAAHYLSEFPWAIAFLYASLVVVTGPTVINPLLKNMGLERRLATVLEGEGVLIDAIGAVLAVVVLGIVINGSDTTALEIAQGLLSRLGVGTLVGLTGGWLLAQFLLRAQFLEDDLKSSVALAAVLGLFQLSQSLQSESGLMTAVLMGMVVRSAELPGQRELLRFKSQLTLLMVSILFILLSASLSLPSVVALGWGGVFTVLALMFIVRPLNVLICTWNSSFTWRQKLFLSWCAPRGIVAASVASLFAILLQEGGVNGGEAIKAQVFLTICLTVFLQGLTAQWVAQILGLTGARSQGIVIVGANLLGLTLAKYYIQRRERVMIIDTSAEACQQAIAAQIPAVVANGLDMKTMAEAGLDAVGSFIALTANLDVNLVIAQRVAEEFKPAKVYAVCPEGDSNVKEVQPAFAHQVELKTWLEFLQAQSTTITEADLEDQDTLESLQLLRHEGKLLPLLLQHQQQIQIVTPLTTWNLGDRLVYVEFPGADLTQGELELN
ncbi:MAG: cation:proton antiporter [Pseudanabaenaceae cyanobacterium bins.68]|nr:cation:proton antiporter [Pseudanabaenaceae cyanobacterium bins.68]